MTALSQTRPASVARPSANGFFSTLLSSVMTWNDQRVTRKSLSRLTDRELNDIGLMRGDLDRM